MDRFQIKIALAAVVVIAALVVEFIRASRRKRLKKDAEVVGADDYLKLLKSQRSDFKARYKAAKSESEKAKWLAKMDDVEHKIIALEQIAEK